MEQHRRGHPEPARRLTQICCRERRRRAARWLRWMPARRRARPAGRTARWARRRRRAARGSTLRALAAGTWRTCATKSRNGSGGRQHRPAAVEDCLHFGQDQLQGVVVVDQVMARAAPAATRRAAASGATVAASSGARRRSMRTCARIGARPAAAVRASTAGSSQFLDRQRGAAATRPAPAATGPPSAPRCAGCRGGRSPAAARRGTRPAGRGCRSAISERSR